MFVESSLKGLTITMLHFKYKRCPKTHLRMLSLEIPKMSQRGDKTKLLAGLSRQLKSQKRQANRLKQLGRDLLRDRNSMQGSKFLFREGKGRKGGNTSFRARVSREPTRGGDDSSSFKESNESFYNSQKRRKNKEERKRIRQLRPGKELGKEKKGVEAGKRLHEVIENDDEILVERSHSGGSVLASRSKSQGAGRKDKIRMRIKRGKGVDHGKQDVLSRKVSIHGQMKDKRERKEGAKIESCRETGRVEGDIETIGQVEVRSERQIVRVDQGMKNTLQPLVKSKLMIPMKKSLNYIKNKTNMLHRKNSDGQDDRAKIPRFGAGKSHRPVFGNLNVSERSSGHKKGKHSGGGHGGHGMKRSLGMKHLEIRLDRQKRPVLEGKNKSSRRRSKSHGDSERKRVESSEQSSGNKFFTLNDSTLEELEAMTEQKIWNEERERKDKERNRERLSQDMEISASLNVSRHRETTDEKIIRRNSALDPNAVPFIDQTISDFVTSGRDQHRLLQPKKMAASLAHVTQHKIDLDNEFGRNEIDKNYSMLEGGERGLLGAEHTPRISGLDCTRNIYLGGKREKNRRGEETKRRSQMNSTEKRGKWSGRRGQVPGRTAFLKKNLTRKKFDLMNGKGMIKNRVWKMNRKDIRRKVAKDSEQTRVQLDKIVNNFKEHAEKESVSKRELTAKPKVSHVRDHCDVENLNIHLGELEDDSYCQAETGGQDVLINPKNVEHTDLKICFEKGANAIENRYERKKTCKIGDKGNVAGNGNSGSRPTSVKKFLRETRGKDLRLGQKFLKKKRGKASAKRDVKGEGKPHRRQGISRGVVKKNKMGKTNKRKSDWDSGGNGNHFAPKYGLVAGQGIPSPNIVLRDERGRDKYHKRREHNQQNFKDIFTNLNENVEKKLSLMYSKKGMRAHNHWKNMDPLSKLKHTTRAGGTKLPLKLGLKTRNDKREKDLTHRAERKNQKSGGTPVNLGRIEKPSPAHQMGHLSPYVKTKNQNQRNLHNIQKIQYHKKREGQKDKGTHSKSSSRNRLEQGLIGRYTEERNQEGNRKDENEDSRRQIQKNKSKKKLTKMLKNKNALRRTKKDIYSQVRGMRKTGQDGNQEKIREREQDKLKYLKQFKIFHFLGKGSYAEVFMAYDKGGSLYNIE